MNYDDRVKAIKKLIGKKPMSGIELVNKMGLSKTCIYLTLQKTEFPRFKRGMLWIYYYKGESKDKETTMKELSDLFYSLTEKRCSAYL